MRKVTKNIVGVISLGVLATSWSLGQAAESGLKINNSSAPQPSESASPTNLASPSPDASSSASPNASTPSPAATKTTAPTTSAASVTKKSDPVSYVAQRQTGTMQISVTKQGSKITSVKIISGGTEGGEWQSVPDLLAQAAVDAQGSDFGNISRATHTTDAFKQALDNALAKF